MSIEALMGGWEISMKNTFEFIEFYVQPLKEDLSVIDCEYFLVDYTIEHFDVVVAQLMIYSRHKVDEVSFSSGSSPIIFLSSIHEHSNKSEWKKYFDKLAGKNNEPINKIVKHKKNLLHDNNNNNFQ